jgi:D-apionolactonase
MFFLGGFSNCGTMKVLSKNVIYHGRDEALPQRVALKAGPVSLFYEGGDLRYLRLGGREIIRRIYAAVRDRNWGTIPAKLANVDLVDRRDSFRVFYEAEHREGDIHFTWRAEIVGEASGRIVFTMDGQARTTFLKNRIGFCVLHPIRECAGAVCQVQRADGSLATAHFPRLIAGEQPVPGFSEMAALAHEDVPGRCIELKFSGELFEAEDQRNWIDASYKTYCTPLRLPFPVEIRSGQRVQQQVAMDIAGSAIIQASAESDIIEIAVDKSAPRTLPRLGFGVSSLNQPLSGFSKERLAELNLAHLRVDVRLGSTEWKQDFGRAAAEANSLSLPLEVALFLPKDWNILWPEVRALLRQAGRGVARFLVFEEGEKSTTARALGLARQHLADFRAPIGAGTNADFYQLNQARPLQTGADFIAWSMNPQVHAIDLASIAETPEAIRAQIESARQYFPNLPLAVSPVTLKPRFNPVATGPEPPVPAGELPPQVDPRQMSLFGAAWTLAAYKHLAEGALDSATFYETMGWRGVVESDEGAPVPTKFRSAPRGVFPMYHVFADIGEFAGGTTLVSVSNRPLAVNAVALRREGQTSVLISNLTDTRQTVKVAGMLAAPKQMRMLDESSADVAMRDPNAFRERWRESGVEVELPPFAYCRLDGEDGRD